MVQYMVDELVNLKGITKNSNESYLITQVIFMMSSSAIYTYQYLDPKLSFIKYFALPNWLNRFRMNGIGYLFLIVTLLVFDSSCKVASSNLVFSKRALNTPNGDLELQMSPPSKSSLSCFLNSTNLIGVSYYGSQDGGLALGSNSIWWSISRHTSSFLGNFDGIMSLNSFRTFLISSIKFSNFIIATMVYSPHQHLSSIALSRATSTCP